MFTIKYVISKHTFSFTAHRILLSNIITTRINWHCLRFKSLTITRGAKRNRCARNVICAVSTRVQYAANRWSMLIGRTTGLEKVRSDSTCDRLHISAEDVNTRVSFRLLPIRKSTLPIEGQAIRIWQKIRRKFTPRVCFHEREIFPIGGPIRS